ncbi:Metalloendopeptidase OMA1, mitochondrial [Intoshia linei]|uniref:Metalloendopeptidase OMA1, mitochondrial n=1 Tax=Intoshia linei TaxID=1819745 RepID=A0A177AT98_9BILA|nr:Metalloendopeptidase OMA1, mitochondrial [Intoshia linei]
MKFILSRVNLWKSVVSKRFLHESKFLNSRINGGLCKFKLINYKTVNFHTTNTKYIAPIGPVGLFLIKNVARITVVVLSRFIRKNYSILKGRYEYLNKILISYIILPFFLIVVYYYSNLEKTLITNRKRFLAFSNEHIHEISQIQVKQIYKEQFSTILPKSHRIYKLINSIVSNLVRNNRSLFDKRRPYIDVIVINSNQVNAISMPCGTILVYTGILDKCQNDNDLAIILAHEMAHIILKHGSEKISMSHIMDVLLIIISATIWLILPTDMFSGFGEYIANHFTKILSLPYSRMMELEADYVGLLLMAKACMNIKNNQHFWFNFDDNMKEMSHLSTHPSSDLRAENIKIHFNEAKNIQKKIC